MLQNRAPTDWLAPGLPIPSHDCPVCADALSKRNRVRYWLDSFPPNIPPNTECRIDDQPAYLNDLAPCTACHNSGEPCGMCGGGGYGDQQTAPLPTTASVELLSHEFCDDCDGTGRQRCSCQMENWQHHAWCRYWQDCETCKGTGKAEK